MAAERHAWGSFPDISLDTGWLNPGCHGKPALWGGSQVWGGWFAAVANFCGVNTPIMADFRLYQVLKISAQTAEYSTIGSLQLVPACCWFYLTKNQVLVFWWLIIDWQLKYSVIIRLEAFLLFKIQPKWAAKPSTDLDHKFHSIYFQRL